jgi:hypothetical protein
LTGIFPSLQQKRESKYKKETGRRNPRKEDVLPKQWLKGNIIKK